MMSSTPEHPLLVRGTAIAENAAFISAVCPALREILNRSVHELGLCITVIDGYSNPASVLHHHVTLHLFRQCIVFTDAVESLLSHLCLDAAAPVLRSAFEANMGLMYVLNGDNQARKALAWHYVKTLDDIRNARRRKELDLLSDSASSGWRESSERLLQQEPLKSIQPAYEEEQRRQNPGKPQRARPKWYSLYSGPRNVEELVDEALEQVPNLNRPQLYEVYRIFSASLHGRAGMHHAYASIATPLQMFPIRHILPSHGNPLIYLRFGAFLMESTKRMAARYLSENQFADYLRWGNDILARMS